MLSDPQVHALIAAAYAESAAFGLYVEVAAVTGARLSQIARLNVADLQNGGEPRLMMPCSRKGRGKRAITHKPVPITADLAAKLKASAAGRAADAPLLLRVDGLRWQTNDFGDHLVRFRKAAIAAGAIVDGKPVSAYSLRHSSIVRMLLANVPARLVASAHDTSLAELEKTYSASELQRFPDEAIGVGLVSRTARRLQREFMGVPALRVRVSRRSRRAAATARKNGSRNAGSSGCAKLMISSNSESDRLNTG